MKAAKDSSALGYCNKLFNVKEHSFTPRDSSKMMKPMLREAEKNSFKHYDVNGC